MIDNTFSIQTQAEIKRPTDDADDIDIEKGLANAALKATMAQIISLLADSDATEINITVAVSKTSDA